MSILEPSDFESLFLARTPFIDVRAPVEFSAGTIPGAINLPLLTDEERHQVGIAYKERGQAAAIELGHQLVGGDVRESRIQGWLQALRARPESVLFCFRGGLRSQITQSWIAERGVQRPLVRGGYQALRRYLLERMETLARELDFEVVSGPTGSGKTRYLARSGRPSLDLEAIARHRGSAFGGLPEPQPAQIDFENQVAVELIHLARAGGSPILIEDESRMIGRCMLPAGLFERIRTSPRLRLEVPLEERVENIFRDYILESALGQSGDSSRFEDFRRAVRAIMQKLGHERASEVLRDLDAAQAEFLAGRGLDSNREWIRKLLVWYYDPLYERSMKREQGDRPA